LLNQARAALSLPTWGSWGNYSLAKRWLLERKVRRYGVVIGNAVRKGVVYCRKRASEVWSESVRALLVARVLNVGFDKDPIQLEFALGAEGALEL
jgi:hypothetical protein